MMNIKRFILKSRLLFSTSFVRYEEVEQEKGFVYEFDYDRFKKLSPEEQGIQVQKNWNKYMKEK